MGLYLVEEGVDIDESCGEIAHLSVGDSDAIGQEQLGLCSALRIKLGFPKLAILDRLLRGEPLTYEGRYYCTATEAMPQPVQRPRPPLIARYADGWRPVAPDPLSSLDAFDDYVGRYVEIGIIERPAC